MEFTVVEGLRTLKFDLVLTLALAALFLFIGGIVQGRVGFLKRASIPAAAIGGLLFASVVMLLRSRGTLGIALDTSLRAPLQIAFFTTIGFGATLSLLGAGGARMILFFVIASLAGVLQNLAGIGVALREEPKRDASDEFWAIGSTGVIDDRRAEVIVPETRSREEQGLTGGGLLRNLLILLAVMGIGALLGTGLSRLRVTLPAYVGAMVVAAVVRNLDDRYGWFRLDMRAIEALGGIALALFLVIALMDLKLWQLAGLAVPMLVILAMQVVLMIIYAVLVTFVLMGRDYEAAVTTGGHIGFGLGITPNAVANMEALTLRYGAAPRSFLIVPIVGAFFIDFSNAVIITLFVNFLR
ncbi:MAG: hypothetical protein LC747_00565 [Acidobacteria bacterium]|nr:hypothetical protein [Acidobacteriota bacterium]